MKKFILFSIAAFSLALPTQAQALSEEQFYLRYCKRLYIDILNAYEVLDSTDTNCAIQLATYNSLVFLFHQRCTNGEGAGPVQVRADYCDSPASFAGYKPDDDLAFVLKSINKPAK